MTTLIEFYSNWLPENQDINLILVNPFDSTNTRELIDIALEFSNIKKIFLI